MMLQQGELRSVSKWEQWDQKAMTLERVEEGTNT